MLNVFIRHALNNKSVDPPLKQSSGHKVKSVDPPLKQSSGHKVKSVDPPLKQSSGHKVNYRCM